MPNIDHCLPPPPPYLELTSGLAKDIKEAHKTLDRIWRPHPNSPVAGFENKMIKGYSVALDVAPFTTY